ncbi:odorant receptor 82a-like [Hylaeus volcanicus]|uniref:odorant receptor 82a-like n=1 Tax=Hylaeus volcanicus TaxID=313075 RepID=UPI0023B7C80E|nr:odorant receptor 82a-like [Hylaeus volcanicus]
MLNSSRENSTINIGYNQDYECSIQVNRWFLKPIGAWPRTNESTGTDRFLVKLLNLVCHSLIVFTFAPCALFILFEDTNLEVRMNAIGPMSHWLMSELNYCCLLLRANDIRSCLKHMENDWKVARQPEHREMMLENAKFGRFIACIAALCMNLGVCSYTIITGFRKTVFHVGNETLSMFQLPCPFYTKLLDVRFSPVNEIVLGMQLMSVFIANSVTVGACGLAAVLATHACGQLDVVMSRLDNMVDSRKGQTSDSKLAYIVEHHLHALSLVLRTEKVMNLICLVELVGCTLNLCLLDYYFLTEKSKETLAIYAIVYVSMTFNIFIFCYIGERITDQCTKVGKRAYMTNWYCLPHKTAAGLILLISRSSMVTKITAGKLVNISLATFGDVFKTSFTYFNMLRTVAM